MSLSFYIRQYIDSASDIKNLIVLPEFKTIGKLAGSRPDVEKRDQSWAAG